MVGGGLMQLVAYGAQDVYLTGCSYSIHIQLNDVLRYKRKYENFEIICDYKYEKELNDESLYFLNKEIYHFQVNLNNINNNPLLTIKPVPKRNKLFNDKLSNKYDIAANNLLEIKKKFDIIDNKKKKEAQKYQKTMLKNRLRISRR